MSKGATNMPATPSSILRDVRSELPEPGARHFRDFL